MEIIDLINELKDFRNKGFKDCSVEAILLKLKRIENDKKVKVPYFVADLIEYAKIRDWDLEDVFLNIANEPDTSDISEWFYTQGNMDVIARAWLDGHEIEQEKRYAIRFKNIRKETNYLKYDRVVKNWYLGAKEFSRERKTYHTKKELESSGFDWVFNCPGIEVKEWKE
nr:MAG TPA: Protein of unknown function (DUF1642) [Caudoviricetes sp.]